MGQVRQSNVDGKLDTIHQQTVQNLGCTPQWKKHGECSSEPAMSIIMEVVSNLVVGEHKLDDGMCV